VAHDIHVCLVIGVIHSFVHKAYTAAGDFARSGFSLRARPLYTVSQKRVPPEPWL